MNSNFDTEALNSLISEALDDSAKPIDRSYGQLGFMESEVIEKIYNAFETRIGHTDLIDVIKDARISYISSMHQNKITDLHTVVRNCRKCQSTDISINPTLPKWNTINPDVVFLIDSPVIDQQSSALFVNSLKTAGFSSSRVCLTYLVRCPVHPAALKEEHILNCSSYTHQEIQIMNPKIICPVGGNALKLFFGPDALIKNYKGKISWLGSWPIFPLYSLPYIIKAGANAEESFHADMLQAYQFCYQKGKKND